MEYKRVLKRNSWVGSKWNPWNLNGFSVKTIDCKDWRHDSSPKSEAKISELPPSGCSIGHKLHLLHVSRLTWTKPSARQIIFSQRWFLLFWEVLISLMFVKVLVFLITLVTRYVRTKGGWGTEVMTDCCVGQSVCSSEGVWTELDTAGDFGSKRRHQQKMS